MHRLLETTRLLLYKEIYFKTRAVNSRQCTHNTLLYTILCLNSILDLASILSYESEKPLGRFDAKAELPGNFHARQFLQAEARVNDARAYGNTEQFGFKFAEEEPFGNYTPGG